MTAPPARTDSPRRTRASPALVDRLNSLGVGRVCDLYADGIRAQGGFPAFELYWTRERRDRVIATCLERLGD